MPQNINSSFLSASTFPVKILLNKYLLANILDKKKISPFHIQLIPTNRCNFSCSFCCCGQRDKQEELNYDSFLKILSKIKKLGCEAVTIAGGGEPLMHPMIGNMIAAINKKNMEVSLTTNGTLLNRLKKTELKCLTWCRVSLGDSARDNLKMIGMDLDGWFDFIAKVVSGAQSVAWCFSYVVTRTVDLQLIKRVILFANRHNFTHVRITPNILDLNGSVDIHEVKKWIKSMNIPDSRVIYQERKNYRRGNKNCYISLLKPVIGADNWIYPCCGAQYAKDPPVRNYDKSMRLCEAIDIDKFCKKQVPFCGSECQRCYYSEYNVLLESLLLDVLHKKFI